MKNILVKSLFEIQDTNWHIRDRTEETDLYQKYVEMHQLSLRSFTNHLKGDWEFKFFSGRVQNVNEAFQKTFYSIYDLWRQGDVNILYTDPDTVALKDINPWNMTDFFMMFNFTDPKSFDQPNQYNRQFPYFFNAGVRLFPAAMQQQTWDIGLEMAKTWDSNTYDTEQIILNSMLWEQGLGLDQVLRPEWCYQGHWLPDQVPLWMQDLWNGIDLSNANILHLHSSRDIDKKLNLMRTFVQQ
jgi:hypothetical protein